MTSATGSGAARFNGQEEIHGVLVGPDGTPVPFYHDEVSQTAHEFAKVESSFRDTQPLSAGGAARLLTTATGPFSFKSTPRV